MRLLLLAVLLAIGTLSAAGPRQALSRHPGVEDCAFSHFHTREVYLDEASLGLTRAALGALSPRDPGLRLPRVDADPLGRVTIPPYVPPTLAKAIGYIESTWAMADTTTPRGRVGGVLTSSSCAYGLMQVLSGMQPVEETERPTPTQRAVLKRYWANMLAGLRLLIEKWNYAGEGRPWPYVGERNPRVVENWYYATWAYYSFSPSQNPANPDYPWPRPSYNSSACRAGAARCSYADFPYQELVFGLVANPPILGILPDGQPAHLWPSLPAELPARRQFMNPERPRRPFWPPPVLPPPAGPTRDGTQAGVPILLLRRTSQTLQYSTADETVLFKPVTTIQNRGRGIISPLIKVTTVGPSEDWLSWRTSSAVTPTVLMVTFNPQTMMPGSYTAAFIISSNVAARSPQVFRLTVCVDGCSGTASQEPD